MRSDRDKYQEVTHKYCEKYTEAQIGGITQS